MTSATAIVETYTEDQFVKKLQVKNIASEQASIIYKKARQIDQRSTVIAIDYKMGSDIRPYAMNSVREVSADYETMFGDNRFCDCKHCQSVYSPSAYFVDILQFIKRVGDAEDSPLTVLTKDRRADIVNILLTCTNTHTPLPYIDLVNELLEEFISPTDIKSHQTTNTAKELAAYPEHVNTKAYGKLSESFASFQLPLNLPLEETRIYLDKLGCPRYQLMELFYGNKGHSKYTDISIAAEYLKLSKQELDYINTRDSTVTEVNDSVSFFLQHTGLSYIDLLQLLECHFINPPVNHGRTITIDVDPTATDQNRKKIDPTTCNIEHLILNGLDSNTSEQLFRFIRLWKKLAWDVLDVDRVFKALGMTRESFAVSPKEINHKLIIPLSHIARIKDQFGLDIPTILSLWSTIDIRVYSDQTQNGEAQIPSLYERLFQNKQVSNPVDPAFRDPHFIDPDELLGPLAEKSFLITAAYNISESDFNRLNKSPLVDGKLTSGKPEYTFQVFPVGQTAGCQH